MTRPAKTATPKARQPQPPEVYVQKCSETGALYLVGPGWMRRICGVCLGHSITVTNEHASECRHCAGSGFEPANPHSSGWGHP